MKNLIKAAKELNEVLGLSPAIEVNAKKTDEKKLTKAIKAAAKQLVAEDEVSEEVIEILQEMKCTLPEEWFEESDEESDEDSDENSDEDSDEESDENSDEDDSDEESDEDSDEEEEEKPAKKGGKKVEMKADKKEDKKAEKAEKPAKKKGEIPMTTFTDEIIAEGGSWEDMFAKLNKEYKRRGDEGNFRNNVKALQQHVKGRMNKNPEYLGKNAMTEKGIFAKKAGKK